MPAIVVSVAIFVLLDLSLLLLNFHIARQIDEDSLAINLAGRERMLSQRVGKNVLAMERTAMNSRRRYLLAEDLVARLGGDEFMVALTRLTLGEESHQIT